MASGAVHLMGNLAPGHRDPTRSVSYHPNAEKLVVKYGEEEANRKV